MEEIFKSEIKNPSNYSKMSDCQSLPPPPSLPVVEERDGRSEKPLIYKHDQDSGQSESGPIRWMSSKMRIMRKIINSDQVVMDKIISRKHATQNKPRSSPCSDETSKGSSSYSNSSSNMIRACADCNTTKTPLWRSGPQGPKSLCNACGIRQRKARRAMAAAAAAAATGGVMATADTLSMASKVPKEKRSDCTTQHKKRCKLADAPHPKKKLLFDDLTISLSKSLAFHQVFPQDEKEAAILLMAISYGLVNG
ncbi:hypothetical protein ACLOJK_037808 [Asimina triloba]